MKKKILVVFGTRPEAIKMAPVVKHLHQNGYFEVKICVTAQHREMLDQVLEFFNIIPDYDLNLMRPNQNLNQLTASLISALGKVVEEFQPNCVLVHGDTTTCMAASITAFYAGCKIGHIEAGLRTHNKFAPYPEEINRKIAASVTDFHFSPTDTAKKNLLKENYAEDSIIVTGNTVIDGLFLAISKIKSQQFKSIDSLKNKFNDKARIILITGHRRENFGEGFLNICCAIKTIANNNPDITIVYPVHLNPNVQQPVKEILGRVENVILIEPQPYEAFVWLMNKAYIIITDSGGVQEEAPSLGKPVLVMRETTERPEAVEAGTVVLVGTNPDKIIQECEKLLTNPSYYQKMSETINPYGDGKASHRIVKYLTENL